MFEIVFCSRKSYTEYSVTFCSICKNSTYIYGGITFNTAEKAHYFLFYSYIRFLSNVFKTYNLGPFAI